MIIIKARSVCLLKNVKDEKTKKSKCEMWPANGKHLCCAVYGFSLSLKKTRFKRLVNSYGFCKKLAVPVSGFGTQYQYQL